MARDADPMNLNIFKEHALEAIQVIRNGDKWPHNNILYDHIRKITLQTRFYLV